MDVDVGFCTLTYGWTGSLAALCRVQYTEDGTPPNLGPDCRLDVGCEAVDDLALLVARELRRQTPR